MLSSISRLDYEEHSGVVRRERSVATTSLPNRRCSRGRLVCARVRYSYPPSSRSALIQLVRCILRQRYARTTTNGSSKRVACSAFRTEPSSLHEARCRFVSKARRVARRQPPLGRDAQSLARQPAGNRTIRWVPSRPTLIPSLALNCSSVVLLWQTTWTRRDELG